MSQKSLDPLLRCLHGAVAAAFHGEMTDRELLDRFLTNQDRVAFEALLRRHGQRVFATCRRVLRHEADVDDAFQATFLVLLNKARSIRCEPSLAGWLTAVAHRVAVRTRCQQARRACREAQTDQPEPAACQGDDLLWHEACAILHEELDRLPERFRQPLVLCYLEGWSRDEVAQALGCSLDVVKGRLERGRDKLRRRLQRRGLTMSAGLLGALGTSAFALFATSATANGLSHHLIQGTLEAAATGQMSSRVAALVQGASYMMNSKLKLMAAAVLAAGLLSGAGLWLFGATPPAEPQPQGQQLPAAQAVRAEPPSQPKEEKKPAEAKKEDVGESVEISGCVLLPDGKPCAGAKLFAPHLKKEMPTSIADIDLEEVGTTDADGQFRVKVKKIPQGPGGALLARGEDLGVDFVELKNTAQANVTLKLVKDQPITGRILNTEGKPVAGVTVRSSGIYVPAGGKLDDYLAGWKKNWQDAASTPKKRLHWPIDSVMGKTTTDKDGRFQLTGLGSERIVQLSIEGHGVAYADPYVILRAGFDGKPYNEAARGQVPAQLQIKGQIPTLYGPDFTFVTEAGKILEGKITDATTGKPLAGISVQSMHGFGQGTSVNTDKEGKYRLEGLPPDKSYRVFAMPPKDSLYMRRLGTADDTPGEKPIRLDLAMVKGIPVSGRLLDKQTGRPVQGGIRFAPLPKNPYVDKPGFDSYKGDRTMQSVDADGCFRVVTIPGPSLLMVQVFGREKANGVELNPYMPAVPDPDYQDLFKHDKDGDQWLFTAAGNSLELLGLENAVKVVDLKEDGGEFKIEVSVDRGKTARIALQDGDGQPLTGAFASGITAHWPIAYKLQEATATVFALDPEKPRQLVFLHPEKKLGGTALVRGDEKEPVVVKLVPLGAVTGVFLEADGTPLAGATISLNNPHVIASELYRALGPQAPAVKTDKDGRFTLPDVVAGMKFSLQTRKGDTYYVGDPRIGVKEVESGKTLDLGERKLKPLN